MGNCMGSGASGPSPSAAGSPSPAGKAPARRYSKADLTDRQIQVLEDRNVSDVGEVKTEAVELRYSWATQRGHYPDEPNKQNQDSCIAIPQLGEFKDISFFGVFDGHGKDGHLCSRYARDHLHKHILDNLRKAAADGDIDFEDVLTRAHITTNVGLRKDNSADDTLSGTTSISLLLKGNMMFFSNLGDSRAILISSAPDGRLVAKAMSSDQTPYRKDERERVKKCGARVLTMEQIEGNAPIHENWGDLELGNEIDEGGDPPRIWSPLGDYPGTAFTRSIGDFFAESLGVIAEPEFTIQSLTESDKYIMIASDGVFEFLTNQMTADMITSHDDLLGICRAIVEVSYGLWLQYEYRTDDITVILLAIDKLTDAPTKAYSFRPQRALSERVTVEDGPRSPIMSSRPVRRRPKKKYMILNSTDEFDDDAGLALPQPPKTAAEVSSITSAIRTNFLFQNIGDAQRQSVIDAMIRVEVSSGEVVILQGDRGDRFYIVESGRYEVRMSAEEGAASAPDGRGDSQYAKFGQWRHEYTTDKNLHPCFGELSLMYGKPRGATVISLQEGVLWALDRKDFKKLLLKSMSSRRRLMDHLRKVKILRCLEVSEIQRLADLLTEKTFNLGEYIITQGTPGDNFYMIVEGSCNVTLSDKGKEEVVNKLSEWDYFGERALLNDETHSSNVVAAADVKVVFINKASFDQIFGPLAQLLDRDRRQREEVAKLERSVPTAMKQFKIEALVSQGDTFSLLLGSFGDIKLTTQSYVLNKVQRGGELKTLETAIEVASLIRQGGTETAQTFLAPLVTILRDPNAVHIFLKTSIIADLAAISKHRTKGFLNEGMLAYIAGCVVSAIQTLHRLGIVYRGIQPENLYLDAEGRVVVFDYRTCKVGGSDMLCYTLCGATDYLAPEQVSLSGHGKAVDFWALGVLLFELATGSNPFNAGGEVATFNKISSLGSSSFLHVAVPTDVHVHVRDIIGKLLLPDASARSGMTRDGISSLKGEPLFSGINWNSLYLDTSPLQPLLEDLKLELMREEVGNIAETEEWGLQSNVQLDIDLSPSF